MVYKVDRLTRSLADFARIVEALDKAGASFVSVTQAFNTTTSMGRLTLNVLLSFAQFEREVTSERIRDKVAASKRKGMWMGGPVPLGYRLENRKLLIDENEVETVRLIFRRYLELGSVGALADELAVADIRTKVRSVCEWALRWRGLLHPRRHWLSSFRTRSSSARCSIAATIRRRARCHHRRDRIGSKSSSCLPPIGATACMENAHDRQACLLA